MKRVLAVVLMMVLCVSVAFAESGSTVQDGVIALQEGKYVIGRDINEGSYTLVCTGTDGEDVKEAYDDLGKAMDILGDSKSYGSLMSAFGGLYEEWSELSIEILGDFGDVLESYTLKPGDSMLINLKVGTALQISEGSCTLTLN